MGEAKRRRDAAGVKDERTASDIERARQDELWRIERHKNGHALADRLYGSGIPHNYRWRPWNEQKRH